MLTQLQKQEFYRNGFIKVAGVVPRLMVDAARQAINHSIGYTTLTTDIDDMC